MLSVNIIGFCKVIQGHQAILQKVSTFYLVRKYHKHTLQTNVKLDHVIEENGSLGKVGL